MKKQREHLNSHTFPLLSNSRAPITKYRSLRETHGTFQVDSRRTRGTRTKGVLLRLLVEQRHIVVVVLLCRIDGGLLHRIVYLLVHILVLLGHLRLLLRPIGGPPPPPPTRPQPHPTAHHLCPITCNKSKKISIDKNMYLEIEAK
jgi:hypothetical protein